MHTEPQKDKNGRCLWLFLVCLGLLYFCSNLEKVIIPGATFGELQGLLGVDATIVTRIGSMFFYAYALMQLVVGTLSDRYGGARVISIGALVMGGGAVMGSYMPGGGSGAVHWLYFARILTGLGAATIYLSMVKELACIFPQSYTTWLGLFLMIGYSGSIVGSAPFIAGVQRWGYHQMVFTAGVLCLAAYLLFWSVYWKRPRFLVNTNIRLSPKGILMFFRTPMNIWLMLTQGLAFGIYYVFQAVIGKKMLEDFCGLSAGGAGLVMTITMVIAATNGFLVAMVFNWLGKRHLPIMRFSAYGSVLSLLIIFLSVLFNIRSGALIAGGMILCAFASNVSPPFTSMVQHYNAPERFATALSVCNSFAYMVPAVMGALCGVLMDCYPAMQGRYGRNSYLLVSGMLLLCTMIAWGACLLLREPNSNSKSN